MIGIYCRVSTDKQEEGYSLAIQEEEGTHYAASRGEMYKVYRDVESGTSSRRLDRIKKDIEAKKIDSLWVINIDRLTRLPPAVAFDFRDYLLLHHIKVIEREHDFDIKSLLNYGVNAIVNYDFIERLRTKTLEGKAAQRNAGRQTYCSLFGYEQKIAGASKNGKILRDWVVNPKKAEVVRLIFEWNTKEKLGLAAICKRLNGKGYKSERGINFEPSAVSRILTHPEYAGKSRSKDGAIIESKVYAPIIDLATWEAAQDSYATTITNNSKRGRVASHAMTNILHCSYCGAGYYYHFGKAPYKWKNSDKVTIRFRYIYYHRHTVPCRNTCKTLSMEVLDIIGLIVYRRAMVEQSKELLTDIAKDIKDRIDDAGSLIDSLRHELEAKQAEINNFETAIAKGLSLETAIPSINRRTAEAKAIKERIAEVERQSETDRREHEAVLAEFSLNKYREYVSAPPKVRLAMFRRILRQAKNKDGILLFELIDGRVYRIDYRAFLTTYKGIMKDAQELLELVPGKKTHEEALEKLKRDFANPKMLDQLIDSFRKKDGSGSALLRDWEYYYIAINHLVLKASDNEQEKIPLSGGANEKSKK